MSVFRGIKSVRLENVLEAESVFGFKRGYKCVRLGL
jgi:hypothetical protein